MIAVLAVNPFGPLHWDCVPSDAVSKKGLPSQTGPSLVAVATGETLMLCKIGLLLILHCRVPKLTS